MPLHDWTRVDDGIFHDFHNAWIAELRRALNGGVLPPGYYALSEQTFRAGKPDVLALHEPGTNGSGAEPPSPPCPSGGAALLTAPPRTRFVAEAAFERYTANQRSLTIRHVSGDRPVALIEIVSPGNKAGTYPFHSFIDKLLGALRQGIHLLILDLYPPSPRDPDGVHGVIWSELTAETYQRPADADRTLAAYSAGPVKTAYVEPVAVGQALRDMPLFLTRDGEGYVEVPLGATYQAAYVPVPPRYRRVLEADG